MSTSLDGSPKCMEGIHFTGTFIMLSKLHYNAASNVAGCRLAEILEFSE